METKRPPVKTYKANLTLNNIYIPTPQTEPLKITSKKVLKFLKGSQRQELTKYELDIFFRYIPGNVLNTLIEELIKDGLIANGGDYFLYLTPSEGKETVVYYLTKKGDSEIENKYKAWFSSVDNQWKIVALIILPVLGYFLGKYFH